MYVCASGFRCRRPPRGGSRSPPSASSARPFDEVTVGELAADAGVTTGALYHHFENKLGLYRFVREDVERRLLDRMEGAAAAHEGPGP